MAFSDLGTLGSTGSKSANQTSVILTTTAAAAVGNLAVIIVACDNNQTTDGDEGAVTSVTDSNGSNIWSKAIEMCNGQGTAQTGATVSIWYTTVAGQIANGGTITANLSNSASRDASGIVGWKFGMATGSAATVGATNTNVGDGAAMTTSLNATTANREALRFRAWGGEEELTTAITPTSGWSNVGTTGNSGTGGVNTSNIIIRGEYHISTGTGDASAPTGGVTCDWASGYVAFYEWAFLPYGWQIQPWQPPIPPFRQRHIGPQSSTARGADPAPEAPYIDWDWGQVSSLTRPAATVIGRGLAAAVGPGNIPSVYSQWVNDGWKIQPPQPPRQPAAKQAGAQLPAAINIDRPYTQWVNGGWEPNQPSTLPRDPSVRFMGGQLQAAANVEIVYQNWTNSGWVPTLPNPVAHPPAARLLAGQLPGPANIAAVFSQWVNDGWRAQPPQPPAARRYQALPEFTWDTAPATPAVTTVGWGFDPFPTQPKYRQRYIGPVRLPSSGPAPPTLEWGFAPNNPQPPIPATILRAGGVLNAWRNVEAVYVFVDAGAFGWDPPAAIFRPRTLQRLVAGPVNVESPYVNWLNGGWAPTLPAPLTHPPAARQLAGVLPAAGNVETVYSQWFNAGWAVQPPQPPHQPATKRTGAQLPAAGNVEVIYTNWINAGWAAILPSPLSHSPAPRLLAGQLPAAANIETIYSQWVNGGWVIQPPPPPHQPALRQNAGQFPAPVNIDSVFVPWINAGWDPDLPQPLIRRPLTRQDAAALPDAANIPSVLQDWRNLGWGAQSPQPPAFRRYQALPELSWRYDAQPATVTINWGFDPFPVQPRYRQRYIGPVRLPASGPAPPTFEWGFAPNNPQPPIPASMQRAGGVLNAWRNNEAVYVFVDAGAVTFGWDPPPFAPPARAGLRSAATAGPVNIPAPYVQWVNLGWDPDQPISLPRDPALRFLAGALPAATNVEIIYSKWINGGWDPVPTNPLIRRPRTGQGAAALPDAANVPVQFQSWRNLGWEAVLPHTLAHPPAPRQAAGQLPGPLNIDYVFQDWRNAGWAATLPNALVHVPSPRQSAAAAAGAVNVDAAYQPWANVPWQIEPTLLPATTRRPERAAGLLPSAGNIDAPFTPFTAYGWPAELPRLPHPKPERAGAILRGDDGTEGQFSYFLGYGWETLPPQPPRPRWERAAASLPAAVNIDTRFENWVNSGWLPVLPTLPAFRRLLAMPELSWRADQITPVAQEWGFQPAVPDALRNWFVRAGAIMPGANIDAPLEGFLPSGWQQIGGWTPPAFRRYPAPNTAVVRGFSPGDLFIVPYEWGFEPTLHNLPRRRWERSAASFPAQLNLPDPYVFVQAVLPPWVAQIPLALARPRLFLGGIASKSQFAAFDFFPLYGWETQSPQPPMPRWRHSAGVAVGDNIEGAFERFLPYGWAPTDPRPLIRPGVSARPAGALSGAANIAQPFVRWINGGWEADLPSPLLRRPLVRQGAAAIPGPTNIEIVYQPWTNRGWQVEPTLLRARRSENSASILPSGDNIEGQFERFLAYGWPAELPRMPHPRPERAGAIQRGDDGTETTFEAFRPYGWENQPPQPPRRRWENSAAAGRFAADIPPRFENWVNLGWIPTLPTLPAFRRYFPMPELTWRSDPIFDFFVVPYEWGFQPVTPEGLRTWFARAAGIMPGANIEAPLFGFLPSGWASQYADILAKPPRRFPVSAEIIAPAQAIRWINAGWEATLPLLTGDPAVRLRGAQLPAAVNIDPQFEAFLAHGWQVLPPHLRHPRPEAAGSILIGDVGIEGPFSLFLPYGWQAQPVQPPHGKWDKAAGVLRGIDGIDARFENWINSGWGAVLPTPLIHDPLAQQAAGALPSAANVETPFVNWINAGWDPTLPAPLTRDPATRLVGGTLPAAFNIDPRFENWVNTGWLPVLPTLPAFRRIFAMPEFTGRLDTDAAAVVLVPYEWGFQPLTPEALRNWYNRLAAIMPRSIIEAKYEQWRNLGWGAQPFQPPRRPWEKNAAAIMRGANIEAKYEQWRNQGWVPTLPMLRIVRRAIALPHLAGQADPFIFVPIPHEWGFVPNLPAALRTWFNRAAAIEAIYRPSDEFIFVEGVTTEFLQTYFIANLARMMGRRG